MPCLKTVIEYDGSIYCFSNERIGSLIGNANNVPSDLTEIQTQVVESWKAVNAEIQRVYPNYLLAKVVVSSEHAPTVNVSIVFSIEANSKHVSKLKGELDLLIDHLNKMGCGQIQGYEWTELVKGGPWWKLGKHKRLYYQLLMASEVSSSYDRVVCLTYLAQAVEDSRLSEFAVPIDRSFEDYGK